MEAKAQNQVPRKLLANSCTESVMLLMVKSRTMGTLLQASSEEVASTSLESVEIFLLTSQG